MGDYTKHCIVLSNGQYFGTKAADVDALFDDYKQSGKKNLVIHFHGGLVSQAAGMQIAQNLFTPYNADAYPVFFVWKSGIWETLPKIIDDIVIDLVFDRVLRHVLRFAEGKINPEALLGARGAPLLTMQEVKEEVDKRQAGIEPFKDLPIADNPEELTFEERKEFEKALLQDPLLQAKLAAIADDAAGGQPTGDRAPAPKFDASVTPDTMLPDDVLAEIKEEGDEMAGTRMAAAFKIILKYGVQVIYNVVKRFIQKRHHGLYCTCVEELLRVIYIGKLGTFTWKEIKNDTEEAFTEKDNYGGHALIQQLVKLDQSGHYPDRITLIGHSTGAIYICHLLDAAKKALPGRKFEIVFLAPACTCELFSDTILKHDASISGFRMFAMSDEVERHDQMIKIAYPRSLLYCVSGLLEPSEVDKPLVGMQRFLLRNHPFDDMDDVNRVVDFLDARPNACVFSILDVQDGFRSTSQAHGDFDNDPATIGSLGHILKNGF